MMPLEEFLKGLFDLKAEKARLNEALKALNVQEEYLETQIAMSMKAEGLDKACSDKWGTATLKREIYPSIEDWVVFHDWVAANDAWELLKKEVKAAAWRDLGDGAAAVPGLCTFEREKVLFRRGKGEVNL